MTDYEENDNIGQEDNLEVWMQKGSKCYWIKKLIELFHAHPHEMVVLLGWSFWELCYCSKDQGSVASLEMWICWRFFWLFMFCLFVSIFSVQASKGSQTWLAVVDQSTMPPCSPRSFLRCGQLELNKGDFNVLFKWQEISLGLRLNSNVGILDWLFECNRSNKIIGKQLYWTQISSIIWKFKHML